MENNSEHPKNADRNGEDAICFMAGPQGAYFSAGVIHAYLAADRKPPVVVAGISAGALAAGAMYQTYSDFNQTASEDAGLKEAARWKWFRRYLDALTYNPLAPIWDALPNPVDFFTDTEPVEDPSCPPELKAEETEARSHYYRLIRLGRWLGGLPTTMGEIADGVVRYVRVRERYASPRYQFLWLVYRIFIVCCRITSHTALHPHITLWRLTSEESKATSHPGAMRRSGNAETEHPTKITARRYFAPQPLLGWPLWLASCWFTALPFGLVWLIYRPSWWLGIALLWVSLMVAGWLAFGRDQISSLFLEPLGIEQGILHKYHLKRWLRDLFVGTSIESPAATGAPFHLLIVAAALSQIKGSNNAQLWARAGVPLHEALACALSVPTLFAPEKLTGKEKRKWLDDTDAHKPEELVLVDGAVIRTNPMPALFNWIHRNYDTYRASIEKLFHSPGSPAPSLRIVYSVPIAALPRKQEIQKETLDIVENALISFSLQRQRDTEMESQQTTFISTLASEIDKSGAPFNDPKRRFSIFPTPISPESELRFKNFLDPSREEALTQVAQGCRRTLESMYRHRLEKFGESSVSCDRLLSAIASHRYGFMTHGSPGLPEVCRHCSKVLNVRPPETSVLDTAVPSFGLPYDPTEKLPTTELAKKFPALSGTEPRIAFIANGGVFRGSFHVGVAAGLRVARITPDLVVGSSVGAIIGAAVAEITRETDENKALKSICELARIFLHCDEKVALTQRLKNLAKQLGIRARSIDISPRMLRKKILQGSRNDSGYAVTGAPPVLIDAISELFLLPHRITQEIAAKFVSGKITDAANSFRVAFQQETLRRLLIEDCIMGSDLLETVAKTLIFPDTENDRYKAQPFLPDDRENEDKARAVAFFATATLLSRRSTVLLGRDVPVEIAQSPGFDFLASCLASSAFPVAFAPRPASEIFPGRGRTDALLCDGGIFDNLPFFPTLNVLADIQESAASSFPSAYDYLRKRQESPMLMIAAGLDAAPKRGPGSLNSLFEIRKLAASLNAHVKVDSFERTADLVYRMTEHFLKNYEHQKEDVDPRFTNRIVPAAVLKILPADADHLNGTFAFCRSVGLNPEKMRTSIGHGCFQTLDALATAQQTHAKHALNRSITSCVDAHRLSKVTLRYPGEQVNDRQCPYFKVNSAEFCCPFTSSEDDDVKKVYWRCTQDPVHRQRRGFL